MHGERIVLPGGAMLRAPQWPAQGEGFDPGFYGAQAQPVGVGGRQSAWFVQQGGQPAVLRHYRRGGMAGKLVRESYLWLGEARTRPFAEFRVMATLRERGVPVPQPLAAAYWREGLRYRGALITARLPRAEPLAVLLREPVWDEVARAIVAMHEAGVWHADLNAYNILLDPARRAWLIDFDRARLGTVCDRARQGNLKRLRRSLEKVAGPQGVAFSERIERAYSALWGARRPFMR